MYLPITKISYASHFMHFFPAALYNFNKQSTSTVHSLGAFYDYDGIMHYGTHAFSKNGKPTIIPVKVKVRDPITGVISPVTATFGQRHGFSETDLMQIYALYRCRGKFIKYFDTIILGHLRQGMAWP